MRTNNILSLILIALAMLVQACVTDVPLIEDAVSESSKTYNAQQGAIKSSEYKLPLSPDYNWGVSQSWGEHCKECDGKYPPNNPASSFCNSSHTGTYTSYGWDFNLPGNTDKGKPILASADGVIKKSDDKKSGKWGNYVLIDHGDNVCTRYAHLLDNSITVVKDQKVCQGLKIGEIGQTGTAYGEHLHFQFEKCNTQLPIAQGFGVNGNYVPKCLMGTSDIKANPLQLTNFEKGSCGWVNIGSGKASGCPLKSNCANKGKSSFGDQTSFDSRTTAAVNYLWRECAINGKSDGKFHPQDTLTRAEGLKIAMELFGFTSCAGTEPFSDVKSSDWFYPYVVCGVKYGIIDTTYSGFMPNAELYFSEASKILVLAAVKAGKIEIKSPKKGHFAKIAPFNWAYKYIETIFHYGGVNFSTSEKDGLSKAKRGEFAVMAAALSPCFCQSMKCSDDSICEQETYSCDKAMVYIEPPPEEEFGGGYTDDVYSISTDVVNSCKPKNCGDLKVYCGSTNDGCGTTIYCGGCGDGAYCDPLALQCMPSCKPKTCASMGVGCGMASDGCGMTLNCGGCGNGFYCDPLTLQCMPSCKPKNCGDLKVYCGSTNDGCGTTLNCGGCGNGFYCDPLTLQCMPSCKPKTCASIGVGCGLASDGCGMILNCGGCGNGYYCDPLTLQCKASCKPKTCASMGVGCGMASDGCGMTLNCGGCGNGFYCDPLTLQCKASCKPKTCAELKVGCGTKADGCGGTIDCGYCGFYSYCDEATSQCKAKDGQCDPAKGYTVMVNVPGGGVQILKSDGKGPSSMMWFSGEQKYSFSCSELPVAMLIASGTPMVQVTPGDASLPAFAGWMPFNGDITLTPTVPPAFTATGYYDSTVDDPYPYNLLLKFPAK